MRIPIRVLLPITLLAAACLDTGTSGPIAIKAAWVGSVAKNGHAVAITMKVAGDVTVSGPGTYLDSTVGGKAIDLNIIGTQTDSARLVLAPDGSPNGGPLLLTALVHGDTLTGYLAGSFAGLNFNPKTPITFLR